MVEAILDWDRLRMKCVRAADMGDFGNIIATDKDSIIIMQGRHEFKVPKSCVEGYNFFEHTFQRGLQIRSQNLEVD